MYHIFLDFRKSSVTQAKMVECILFDLTMVGKTLWNLNSPFVTIDISRLLRTSGFNVKVLNINLTAFCILFFNFQRRKVTSGGN